MRALRTGLVGAFVLSSSLLSGGCGASAEEVGSLIDGLNTLAEATASAIADGTSNTIQVGEQTGGGVPQTSAAADQVASPLPGGNVGGVPVGGAPVIPTVPPAQPSEPQASQAAIDALGDKVFSFSSSSGNSDNNAFVTSVTDLQLCRFGKFAIRETTSFSSDIGGQFSTTNSIGSWTVLEQGGRFGLRLTIEQSENPNFIGEQFMEVSFGNGNVFFNGNRADVSDASADCAAAEREFAGR
ncbi:MAG: hypothetical protein ACKVS9_08025 [Phycisphaerae bacterium]